MLGGKQVTMLFIVMYAKCNLIEAWLVQYWAMKVKLRNDFPIKICLDTVVGSQYYMTFTSGMNISTSLLPMQRKIIRKGEHAFLIQKQASST